MLLTIMMMWCMSFGSHPTFSQSNPGQYVEIVNVQYDASANQTYGVLARYGVDLVGQSPYLMFLEPLPFVGKVTKADIMATVNADPYITKVVN